MNKSDAAYIKALEARIAKLEKRSGTQTRVEGAGGNYYPDEAVVYQNPPVNYDEFNDEELILLKITTLSAGGKYLCKEVYGASTFTASGNLNMPEGMTLDSTEFFLAANPLENGSSGHLFKVGDYVWAIRFGLLSDGSKERAIIITGAPVGDFPVKCTKDGGGAGSSSSTCTFTYTVKDLSGTTLGTGVSVEAARIENVEYNIPAADSYGTAFYDGSTLKLKMVLKESPKSGAGCA